MRHINEDRNETEVEGSNQTLPRRRWLSESKTTFCAMGGTGYTLNAVKRAYERTPRSLNSKHVGN